MVVEDFFSSSSSSSSTGRIVGLFLQLLMLVVESAFKAYHNPFAMVAAMSVWRIFKFLLHPLTMMIRCSFVLYFDRPLRSEHWLHLVSQLLLLLNILIRCKLKNYVIVDCCVDAHVALLLIQFTTRRDHSRGTIKASQCARYTGTQVYDYFDKIQRIQFTIFLVWYISGGI